MITRRFALLVLVYALGVAPAFAQRHPPHGKAHAPAADQPTGSPANTPIGPVDTTARWAFIQDFNTGATLLDKQGRRPDAAVVDDQADDALHRVCSGWREGRMKLDDQLPVSEKAWRMGGSKMFVQIGTTVAVEDLIRGIVVDSGNDACIVLAEAISGSEEQFADLMNDTAKKLGLTNSHFMNATGWPADNHYMSCHDIATLAGDIIRQFPQYYHYDSEKTFKYNNIEQGNRNPLVQKGHRGRVEDRAYRGGRLRRRRQHQAGSTGA